MNSNIPFLNASIAQALDYTAPILFAALGGVMSENAGVVNIALEGMMRFAAFFGVWGSFVSGNAWVGLLWGVGIGIVLGALHAYITVKWAGDQIISGVAINVMAMGMITYLLESVFKTTGYSPPVAYFGAPASKIHLAFLKGIPILGAFAELTILIWFALILVVVLHFVLYHTVLGLRIRAVGENPHAAETLGVNVFKIKWFAVISGSVLAAFGGLALSLGTLSSFTNSMAMGKGFIGLAAMIFGKWTPFGALGAILIFAGAQVLQLFMQGTATGFAKLIPLGFYLSLPYMLTIGALIGVVGKAVGPASDGVPYKKES
ncbi:MAG: ABC transporter permease [Caldisericaceae bacterium]|nr:ABC transporter permease [Caldisericaceae bacterium]RLD20182.1 MAG: ABC transporter permease [Caldisericota bacterium]